MSRFSLTTILALVFLASTANAWGKTAHQAIATLTYSNLNPSTKAAVDAILAASSSFSTLEGASTWPDEIRRQRPQTGSQHFVNYPGDDPLNGSCANTAVLPDACNDSKCVVTAIALYAQALASSKNARPTAQTAEQLAFLVHFASDLAQPLHASGYEKGGNGVDVVFRRRQTNIHSVWDTSIPEYTIQTKFGRDNARWIQYLSTLVRPGQALAECAASANPTNVDQVTKCAEVWAKESTDLVCKTVYPAGFEPGQQTAEEYYEDVYKVVDTQVAKAALRLAALLNKIYGGRS
ncbi:S1/P1 nuclease [Catenaria anguillulae PL171]|uniref:S1/P1 nuclease n=1 Tax=Catenaria anguillulae PL171 TaxID=765915 RepID=A0A1Y2I2F2_9FUNG|nr:S1/P1 nuclease [Catenaria anguillulae PL171]